MARTRKPSWFTRVWEWGAARSKLLVSIFYFVQGLAFLITWAVLFNQTTGKYFYSEWQIPVYNMSLNATSPLITHHTSQVQYTSLSYYVVLTIVLLIPSIPYLILSSIMMYFACKEPPPSVDPAPSSEKLGILPGLDPNDFGMSMLVLARMVTYPTLAAICMNAIADKSATAAFLQMGNILLLNIIMYVADGSYLIIYSEQSSAVISLTNDKHIVLAGALLIIGILTLVFLIQPLNLAEIAAGSAAVPLQTQRVFILFLCEVSYAFARFVTNIYYMIETATRAKHTMVKSHHTYVAFARLGHVIHTSFFCASLVLVLQQLNSGSFQGL